ncbi:plasmid mobilization relaxosome protein MobC [Chitinophaga sp. SYP-B3965]|uniref:plasmid mobilization protein n=1 Tax=Chitinophaga sp. SYP-B3965 TaxID=2663120 RepID=UPI001299FCDE|nr:plasmid mobilization relaxosome protein MobC [Chitinophaga sp. SYP-B3965]MRG48291.1 plasmid mobilization relaxosome protein MobC [Chitinophaga sp. SYP-B3965]
MARPPKNGGKNNIGPRDDMIRVRVSQAEKKRLHMAAQNAGYTLSDFLRVTAINAIPRTRIATPERAAFIRGLAELGKIGSNINQIARNLNRRSQTGGDNSASISAELIAQALRSVDTLSHHLAKMFQDGD